MLMGGIEKNAEARFVQRSMKEKVKKICVWLRRNIRKEKRKVK